MLHKNMQMVSWKDKAWVYEMDGLMHNRLVFYSTKFDGFVAKEERQKHVRREIECLIFLSPIMKHEHV